MCVGLSVLCVNGVRKCIEFMLYEKICAILELSFIFIFSFFIIVE